MSLFTPDVLQLVQGSRLRKDEAARRLRYYWDEQSQETLQLIARKWSRPDDFRIFSINMVRKIVDKRASTYRLKPRRNFVGMDQATGDAIYRSLNADGLLKKASRYTKLLKTSVLQVGWNEATGSPTLNVLTPNVLDVQHAGDPETLTRLIVTHDAGKAEDRWYSDWTATTFNRRNYRGARIRTDGNQGGENPYGIIPFVPLFDRLPDDRFFLPGGDDLIEAQTALNVALVNLWRSVETQAHGQPWATGISANEVLHLGPNRVIALPNGGQFGFASPNAPISDILAAIEFLMRQTAATHDCGADVFDLSTLAESGSAKHAERIELKEARLDDLELWRLAEHRLFEVVKVVVNTHAPGTIPPGASLSVDFAELQDQLTEAEALDNTRTKIELGLWSPVDALLALNPDGFADRNAAHAELSRRRDESAALALPL